MFQLKTIQIILFLICIANIMQTAHQKTPSSRSERFQHNPYDNSLFQTVPDEIDEIADSQDALADTLTKRATLALHRARNIDPRSQNIAPLTLKDNRQATTYLESTLSTGNFSELEEFAKNNSAICHEVMQHNQFGISNLKKLLTNNFLCTFQQVPSAIFCINHIPNQQLEAIQPSGQALIHAFSPWHWNAELMYHLNKKGINLAIQTQEPDQHPGSTMATIVIGYVFYTKHNLNKGHTDKAERFLSDYFNQYPHTLTLTSLNNANIQIPCWRLLDNRPYHQAKIYSNLNEEAKSTIKQHFE